MRISVLTTVLVAPLLMAVPAKSQEWVAEHQWTLDWLGNVCSSLEIEDQLLCGAYIQGVFAGQRAEATSPRRRSERHALAFCRPEHLTVQDMAGLISKHALERPEPHLLDAHEAVADLFAKLWPCDADR